MQCPHSLEAIVESLFTSICDCVPNVDHVVFACREDDRNIRVVQHSGYVVSVTIGQSIKALLCLVIPDLYLAIITTWHEMTPVAIMAEIDTVDTCLVTIETEIGVIELSRNGPDFNSSVEGSRSEHVSIFGIDAELHHVVLMVVVWVYFLPVLLPIKHQDAIVVTTAQHVGQCGVHNKVSNEVGVLSTDGLQLLWGIVVIHPNFGVIWSYDYPLLAGYKLGTPNGCVSDLERLNLALWVVVEDHYISSVKSNKHPG